MITVFLFGCTVTFAALHFFLQKIWSISKACEIFLSYLLLFNMGIMGLLAAYAHTFMAAEIAREIGWQPSSPFQFEVAMANLAFGVLGILAYWIRNQFWEASIIGWSIFLFGCLVGHLIDYYTYHNDAPYNIGLFVWANDLVLPILALTNLLYLRINRVKL